MAAVQVNFGMTVASVARGFIEEAIARCTRMVIAGTLSEADYKRQTGFIQGLNEALKAIDEAERKVSEDR